MRLTHAVAERMRKPKEFIGVFSGCCSFGRKPFHCLRHHYLAFVSMDLTRASAMFGGYVRDPLCSLSLEIEDYRSCGEWMAQSAIPSAAILEGGYSDDLPLLIDAFLSGWDSHPVGMG